MRLRRSSAAGVAGLAALATVGGVVVATAGSAGATSTATVNRIAGADRFATAALLAEAAFPAGSANVIIASGENANYPDALAGNYLASQKAAPILLTHNTSTPKATTDALTKLGAKNIWVLGDNKAVSDAQVTAWTAAGFTVNRLSGPTRYDTDKAVVEAGGASAVGVVDGLPTAIVVRGDNFADAVSASALSYAKHLPIIMTTPTSLSTQASAAIKDLGIKQVIIAGNNTSVSAADQASITALGATIAYQAAGTDRSNTSSLLATWAISKGLLANTSFDVATGDQTLSGVDALAGGPFAGVNGVPILITNTINVPGSVTTFATSVAKTATSVNIFGTTASVSAAAATAITSAVQSIPSNQVYTVSPTSATTKTVSSGGANSDNAGVVQYTATGLGTQTVYIALVKPSDITMANGQATFATTTTAGLADLTAPTNAKITVVNGVATGGVTKTTAPVTPVSGSVTFTVDSTVTDTAIPVVFSAADGNNTLSVNATAVSATTDYAPTEAFGVGGQVTWTPTQGALGAFGPGAVTTANVANKYFVSGGFTYNWDSNDTYQYSGIGITQAQFESLISTGSTITGAYSPTSSGVSTFNISAQAAPVVAAGVAAKGTAANSITLTFTPSAADSAGTTYTVLRSSDGGATYTAVSPVKTTDSSGNIVWTDNNLASGTYQYEVKAAQPVTGKTTTGAASNAITIASTVTAPKSAYAAEKTSTGLAGTLDGTDVLVFAFNSAMDAPASGDTIQLKDADGTIVNLVAGTNATFALSAGPDTLGGVTYAAGSNQVLTVTLTGAPTVVQAGTVTGAQFPLTVVDQSGVTGGGANWNIAGSSDVTVEQ